jgi:hypothetical protein
MTTIISWLKRNAKRGVGKIARIKIPAQNVSRLPQENVFFKWLTWKKILLIFLVLPWGVFAVLYGFFYVVVNSTLFPYSVPIRILNNHRKPLLISYVGIDGRRLSDGSGNYEHGLGEMVGNGGPSTARLTYGDLFKWSQWDMQSGMITPNISHRLVLHVHTPLSPAKKIYSCELVVPRSYGMIIIDLWESNNNKMSCQYFYTQEFSFLGR